MKLSLTCMLGILAVVPPAFSAEEGAKIEEKAIEPAKKDAKDPAQDNGAEPAEEKGGIPKDLVDDPHVREELAVNEFTAPSISKLFDTLQFLMPLPIVEVERKMPARMPPDRADLAMELGFLI